MALYRTLSVLAGLLAFACAVFAACALPRHPRWATAIPRWKIPGMALGTLVLMDCAFEAGRLLPGTQWPAVFWLLVPVTLVLAWKTLDFLFARAFAGAWVLLVNYLIQNAFAYYCGIRPLYAVAALVWGVCATIALFAPWQFRNLLESCAKDAKGLPNRILLGVGAITGLLMALLPFVGRT